MKYLEYKFNNLMKIVILIIMKKIIYINNNIIL